jgi:hypothetical protein
MACTWLVGGSGVALGGLARPFCLLPSPKTRAFLARFLVPGKNPPGGEAASSSGLDREPSRLAARRNTPGRSEDSNVREPWGPQRAGRARGPGNLMHPWPGGESFHLPSSSWVSFEPKRGNDCLIDGVNLGFFQRCAVFADCAFFVSCVHCIYSGADCTTRALWFLAC